MPDRPDLLFIGGPFDMRHAPDPRHPDVSADHASRIAVPNFMRYGGPVTTEITYYRAQRIGFSAGGDVEWYVTVWTCLDRAETARKVWAFMAKRSGLELVAVAPPVIL